MSGGWQSITGCSAGDREALEIAYDAVFVVEDECLRRVGACHRVDPDMTVGVDSPFRQARDEPEHRRDHGRREGAMSALPQVPRRPSP